MQKTNIEKAGQDGAFAYLSRFFPVPLVFSPGVIKGTQRH
jgi:hypothetical protein